MDCSPPGSSVHGILKARILEWLPFPSPGDLPNPRIEPWSPHCRQILYWQSHKGSPNLLSVQFSCSVVSNSLWPRGLQHFRLPSSSPTPGACSDSCPLSRWCHLTISYSVIPFSSCLQSFPASGSFPASQFFSSGGQSIGVSACASVLPMNIQDLFPLGWTGLIVCIGHSCLLLWSLFKSFTHFLLVCLLVIHSSFHAMDVSLIYVLWIYSPRM